MIKKTLRYFFSVLAIVVIAFSSVPIQKSQATSLESGLVGWWKFNEGAGTTASDSSVSNLDGTFVNSSYVHWDTGATPACTSPSNTYITFDGPTDADPGLSDGGYIDVGDHAELKPDSVTLSAWVKRPAQTITHENAVIAGNYDMGEGQYGYGLVDAQGTSVYFDNYSINGLSSSWVTDNTWVHITATYDATTGVASLYQNGALVNSVTASSPDPINYSYAQPFSIGAGLSQKNYFNGSVDDVRVYDHVLTPTEVESLAESTGACPAAEPADDADGVTLATESAAPNSGDANNDGIQDGTQAKVTSLISPESGKYIVLESSTCTSNSAVSTLKESSLNAIDGDYIYPAGLLDFTLTGCGVGATETITQYIYGDYDISRVIMRKYNQSTKTYATISDATISAVTIGGQKAIKVVYSVTDGGVLDRFKRFDKHTYRKRDYNGQLFHYTNST
jgi:hypothetical protein